MKRSFKGEDFSQPKQSECPRCVRLDDAKARLNTCFRVIFVSLPEGAKTNGIVGWESGGMGEWWEDGMVGGWYVGRIMEL